MSAGEHQVALKALLAATMAYEIAGDLVAVQALIAELATVMPPDSTGHEGPA